MIVATLLAVAAVHRGRRDGAWPSWRTATWINAGAATLVFLIACALPWQVGTVGSMLLIDPLAAHLALLTAFVAMTTAWYSLGYVPVEIARRRLDRRRVRIYHVSYQCFVGGMLLALLSNNLGVTWVAIETATIAAVMVVGAAALPRGGRSVVEVLHRLRRRHRARAVRNRGAVSRRAARARPRLARDELERALPAAGQCDSAVLNLAFVFLLLGYGTKAGLAPLHAWMPDAHAEGPTPVSAVLAGSILNVALFVILRLRDADGGQRRRHRARAANHGARAALGAARRVQPLAPARREAVLRVLHHRAERVAAFAFGLGGPAAIFAGVLHMTLHTLTKAAIFQCVGRAAQLKGGQRFADIGGLMASHRLLGLTLALAIAGSPRSRRWDCSRANF